MQDCIIIDTYQAFIEFWKEARQVSIEQQIAEWETKYMAAWPELFDKQVQDYRGEGLDWRQIAHERIFPYYEERVPSMLLAHEYLLRSFKPIFNAVQQKFGYDLPLVFVIYVGIGLGAGWATAYQNSPAVLFGLEAIAEEGWSNPEAIEELIAHALGHLVHSRWRAQSGKINGSGPWWQLYEEGFAQRCAHILMGKEGWYMASGTGYQAWQEWCMKNERWLAAEFLRRTRSGDDIRPFFGSWFDLQGQKQTGYFLGHELIKELEANYSIEEIAVVDNLEGWLKPLVTELAFVD